MQTHRPSSFQLLRFGSDRLDLLQVDEARQTIDLGQLGFALNQRQAVVDEALVQAVAGLVDPLEGNLLLGVGNDGEVEQLGVAAVHAVLAGALKADHLVGDACDRVLNGGLAGGEGLVDVGLGGAVCRAALQQGKLDAANLRAGLALDVVGQVGSQTAQLGVAEGVLRGVLVGVLGDEGAVLVVDALGDDHQALLLGGVDLLDLRGELVQIEVDLGQVDQVGALAAGVGQRGGGGQPAGVTAHALDDGDHAGVVHGGIAVHFHDGGGDELGRGGEAGAVVGAGQVVVDGLRDAHAANLIAVAQHELGDLVAGIHGVVAAVVEEVADVVLLEHLQDLDVVGLVHIGVGQLVAAGAQRGGGGVLQEAQLLGILQPHIEQAVSQHALDAVLRAQHLRDGAGLQRRVDDAVGAGIDDG